MKLGFISLLIGSLALAQSPIDPPLKTQFNSAWTADDHVILIPQEPMHPNAPATLIDTNGKFSRLPFLPGQKETDGPFGQQNIKVNAPNGIPLGISVEIVPASDPSRAPRQDMKMSLFRFDAKKWQWDQRAYGTLRSPNFFISHMLSSDYLLGIAPTTDTFVKDGQCFPFAVFKFLNP